MADKLFGTDGIRDVANKFPLNADFCLKLAIILAQQICLKQKRVAIARDTRISGQMLQASRHKVLMFLTWGLFQHIYVLP